MQKAHEYLQNGVSVKPAIPSPQDVMEIRYDGLLPKSGATEVFAHISFDNNWRNVYDYKMSKMKDGFVTSIHLPRQVNAVNFCFRDAANNWDNNSGRNYSVGVSQGYYSRQEPERGYMSKDVLSEDDYYSMLAGSEWC